MPDGIRWVGLDVHARETTVAVFDQATGEVLTRRVVGRPHELVPLLLEVPRPELTLVTVPSVEREQLRDLVRCREDIRLDLMRGRNRIGKFLLRREIYWDGPVLLAWVAVASQTRTLRLARGGHDWRRLHRKAGPMVIIAVVRLPGRELDELLPSVIPADHARQTIADHYVERGIGRAEGRPWRVLDLGCGSGSSVDLFRARDPDVQWVGLDVPESPEPPTRTDARFETFDGISIPFGEGSFDLVYCKQVLEHVRHPKPLLADVRRILAPGGYFAGSTSQLEPFHSLSMWNYTPLGFYEIAKEAGLRLIELRPSIDGLTLIARRLVRRGRPFDRWWARWWGGSRRSTELLTRTAARVGWM